MKSQNVFTRKTIVTIMYFCNMLLNVMLFFPQLSRLLWNMYDYYVRGRGGTGTSLWSGFLAYVPTWTYFVPWLKLICNYNDFAKFIKKWVIIPCIKKRRKRNTFYRRLENFCFKVFSFIFFPRYIFIIFNIGENNPLSFFLSKKCIFSQKY